MAVGNLVTLDIRPDGLHIKLEPEGREYLESEILDRYIDNSPAWKEPHSVIIWELLERYAVNGGPELLSDGAGDYNAIGALTGAPIIAYDVERNDRNELINVGDVFWFPNYAVESELETLLEKGEVVFQKGE